MGTAPTPSTTQVARAGTCRPVSPTRSDVPAGGLPTEAHQDLQRQGIDATLISFSTAARAGRDEPTVEDLLRVGEVRRTVVQRLKHCGLTALADDVALIVSELITNAILHDEHGAEVQLLMALFDGRIVIIVADGTAAARTVQHAGECAEHGRGLAIVNAIVGEHHGRWGPTADATGTWCELPVPTARSTG
ncbi:ATP-binding protein [Streptomyces sp. NPDC002073]